MEPSGFAAALAEHEARPTTSQLQAEIDAAHELERVEHTADRKSQSAAKAFFMAEQQARAVDTEERQREIDEAFQRGARSVGASSTDWITEEQHDAALLKVRAQAQAQLRQNQADADAQLEAAAAERRAAVDALQRRCDEAVGAANTARTEAVSDHQRMVAAHEKERAEFRLAREGWAVEHAALLEAHGEQIEAAVASVQETTAEDAIVSLAGWDAERAALLEVHEEQLTTQAADFEAQLVAALAEHDNRAADSSVGGGSAESPEVKNLLAALAAQEAIVEEQASMLKAADAALFAQESIAEQHGAALVRSADVLKATEDSHAEVLTSRDLDTQQQHEKHSAALDHVRAGSEASFQRFTAAHQKELQDLEFALEDSRRAHSRAADEMQEEHSNGVASQVASMAAAAAGHEAVIAALREDYAGELRSLGTKHEIASAEHDQRAIQRVLEAQGDCSTQVAAQADQHTLEIRAIERKCNERVDEDRARIEATVEATMAARLAEGRAQSAAEVGFRTKDDDFLTKNDEFLY